MTRAKHRRARLRQRAHERKLMRRAAAVLCRWARPKWVQAA